MVDSVLRIQLAHVLVRVLHHASFFSWKVRPVLSLLDAISIHLMHGMFVYVCAIESE